LQHGTWGVGERGSPNVKSGIGGKKGQCFWKKIPASEKGGESKRGSKAKRSRDSPFKYRGTYFFLKTVGGN